jgi:hypothetical protein
MTDYTFYVNIFLFAIGIALIFVLFLKQNQHPRLIQILLLFYFLVFLQYNFERIFTEKVLIGFAALSFLAWVRQPTPVPEES